MCEGAVVCKIIADGEIVRRVCLERCVGRNRDASENRECRTCIVRIYDNARIRAVPDRGSPFTVTVPAAKLVVTELAEGFT